MPEDIARAVIKKPLDPHNYWNVEMAAAMCIAALEAVGLDKTHPVTIQLDSETEWHILIGDHVAGISNGAAWVPDFTGETEVECFRVYRFAYESASRTHPEEYWDEDLGTWNDLRESITQAIFFLLRDRLTDAMNATEVTAPGDQDVLTLEWCHCDSSCHWYAEVDEGELWCRFDNTAAKDYPLNQFTCEFCHETIHKGWENEGGTARICDKHVEVISDVPRSPYEPTS